VLTILAWGGRPGEAFSAGRPDRLAKRQTAITVQDCSVGEMGMTMPADRTRGLRLPRGCGARTTRRFALAVLAGLAWWLAAPPASAQQNQPDTGSDAAADAGREGLLIVGSTTLQAITDAILHRLDEAYVLPKPITRLEGTSAGFAAFCAGIGPKYADIVAASDRMGRGEFEVCTENKVLDIIEVEIGDSAVVVVTKKGDQVFNLTPRMVYFGLAENIPIKGEFKANPNKTWKDADKDAPELPIQFIIPAKGSGTRSFFDDNFMQGGCRHVKELDAIFAATDRVPLCITQRDDGPVEEVNEDQAVDSLLKAPPGALAVIGWPVYLKNRDKLELLPINGVLPSHENIDDDSYVMTARLRYYFKRAHMRGKFGGQGVVEGIWEFMDEIVKDEASGEGGYLEKVGMVALDDDDRLAQKKVVRRLKRFQP
jgi:phosphate transport system substrate-binding protein